MLKRHKTLVRISVLTIEKARRTRLETFPRKQKERLPDKGLKNPEEEKRRRVELKGRTTQLAV